MINKLIGLFKSKGINRNYLQNKPFSINISRQIKQKQDIKKNFQSKKFKKNTKILDYSKKFI